MNQELLPAETAANDHSLLQGSRSAADPAASISQKTCNRCLYPQNDLSPHHTIRSNYDAILQQAPDQHRHHHPLQRGACSGATAAAPPQVSGPAAERAQYESRQPRQRQRVSVTFCVGGAWGCWLGVGEARCCAAPSRILRCRGARVIPSPPFFLLPPFPPPLCPAVQSQNLNSPSPSSHAAAPTCWPKRSSATWKVRASA